MASVFDSAQFNQNLFFPRPDRIPSPRDKDELYVPVEDSIQIHVRRHPLSSARFSLLYFHGNGEIVADYDDFAPLFAAMGAELLVCDYRGYGKSGGSPTLRGVLKDAGVLFDSLRQGGKFLDTVVVMGRSLGSAPAIELCASRGGISGCVIESGYADPIPLVERRGIKLDSTTPEEDALFNNSRKIGRISCPLLILHGREDELILPAEAELNFRSARASNKKLEILDGVGHNDICYSPEYFPLLKRFFDDILKNFRNE